VGSTLEGLTLGEYLSRIEKMACCAGHCGLHDEAVKASERALELEPRKQAFVNDLGWSLFQAGRLAEAENVLARAVAMDASDDLARENLRACRQEISRTTMKAATANNRFSRMVRKRSAG
jgi:Flp pilus assembly protein TadD